MPSKKDSDAPAGGGKAIERTWARLHREDRSDGDGDAPGRKEEPERAADPENDAGVPDGPVPV
jgi:hypothetical protein